MSTTDRTDAANYLPGGDQFEKASKELRAKHAAAFAEKQARASGQPGERAQRIAANLDSAGRTASMVFRSLLALAVIAFIVYIAVH